MNLSVVNARVAIEILLGKKTVNAMWSVVGMVPNAAFSLERVLSDCLKQKHVLHGTLICFSSSGYYSHKIGFDNFKNLIKV